MGSLGGHPKKRHVDHFQAWLEGKIGRPLILGNAPPFEGVPSPLPGPPINEGELTLPILPGDYNADGTVDAADYVVWRKNHGSATPMPNDTTPGSVTADDYEVWRRNFGIAPGTLSGLIAAVPEPASFFYGFAILMLFVRRSIFPARRR
jgi:hypothetical protein